MSIETNFQILNNKYNALDNLVLTERTWEDQSNLLSMRMPGYLTQFFDSIIHYLKVFETIMR